MPWLPVLRGGLILAFLLGACLPGQSTPADPGAEFFEKNIRPLLEEQCYSCHSHTAEKVKGGLLLDSRDAVLTGGDSGPAIVPGDPDKSLLIKAVRYSSEELQMPPKGKKLAPAQITALEQWVKMGAPDPRLTKAKVSGAGAAAREHWAFKPVARPSIPDVGQKEWVQTPVDAFVLAKLEARQLNPSPRADARTLLRRASFDLIGLPPTPEEMAAFVEDLQPGAYARAVERLLASPRYGERWGRYWLDVARYADTKGYVFEEERRYPYAYTYRDYVIHALNEDLPYNQFIVEQLAADQLPLTADKGALAALGYLTLGRRFLNNPHDIIDDRIDVVTRGMMGLTVSCARCHDHKFDPISTKEYYSLYGVFANCSEPEEKPMLGGHSLPARYSEYEQEHQKRLKELTEFRQGKEGQIRGELRRKAGDYMLAARDAGLLPDPGKAEALARQRKLDPKTVQRWKAKLEEWNKDPHHPVFAPWLAVADCSDDELREEGGQRLAPILREVQTQLNPLIAQMFAESPPASLRELAERYNDVFTQVDSLNSDVLAAERPGAESAEARFPAAGYGDATVAELASVLFGAESPTAVPEAEITRLFDVPSIQKLRALKRKVEELDATHPGAPPRAMALQDNPVPRNSHILIRGNPANQGPEAPRRFLTVLAGENQRPFEKGSGRLELAEAIASPQNPLTARVMVNRVWLHYFGAGLVRTPSDFGLRSEPPSHPELLDYLASRFMDEGWSLKNLHRLILLSSTYQQTSDDNAAAARVDPANQLLWKMNRRRLDFEGVRDSLLAVSGNLDLSEGGHSVDLVGAPFPRRRTVYGFVERQNLPGLFRTFDFATPDTTSPQRFSTTVPQQALFMINSPFVVEQARSLMRRAEDATGPERVRILYELLFQREPSSMEVALATRFTEAQAHAPVLDPAPPVWQYGYGQYDSASGRVRQFHALPQFTGDSWQGGASLPDPALGWVQLKAGGGHPGNDHEHAAVLRWIAPRALTIGISGMLGHMSENGDGVEAWIVSSSVGELGCWAVRKGKESTRLPRLEVEAGEAIDFIVDCRGSADSDGYSWSPVIQALNNTTDASGSGVSQWDARQDFSGPPEPIAPLTPWEKYAQVLLMSNELVFVD